MFVVLFCFVSFFLFTSAHLHSQWSHTSALLVVIDGGLWPNANFCPQLEDIVELFVPQLNII